MPGQIFMIHPPSYARLSGKAKHFALLLKYHSGRVLSTVFVTDFLARAFAALTDAKKLVDGAYCDMILHMMA
jgi:hypothetical protein